MLRTIEVDKNLRDRFKYPDSGFPFAVWTDPFRVFLDHTVNCHWHHDLEYGYVLSGSVDYYIDDTHIKLRAGDALFVNSNMLHMGRQANGCEDAVMSTVTFPASLLSPNINGTVYAKYIQPVIGARIAGFRIASDDPRGRAIGRLLQDIFALEPGSFGYELECLSHAARLWKATLAYIEEGEGELCLRAEPSQHAERMKEILSYIHAHYHERITVEDIARYVNISRSECFRCFKRFMNKRPVEYINEYRLSAAAELLRETERNMTDIYTACGFESASYFGKVFKAAYAMTPLKYRKLR